MLNLQGDVIAIVDSTGAVAVKYQYDAWGKEISHITSGSYGSNLYNYNALKYRGYYYDVETGFYYVSSRYYDPEIGRFISADGYITTGQGVLSYNMYTYCLNNPVNRVDTTGNSSLLAQMWTSTMWWLCAVDSVLPIGDMIYLAGALLLGVAAINSYSDTTITAPSTTTYKSTIDSKEEEKVNAVTKTNSSSTPIYRYGGTTPEKYVPSERDVETNTGLSFSTIPKPGAAMTTIDAVNSTGVLIAIKDGKNHVSVYPIGTTMEGWKNAGVDSVWTTTLYSIVIKWAP